MSLCRTFLGLCFQGKPNRNRAFRRLPYLDTHTHTHPNPLLANQHSLDFEFGALHLIFAQTAVTSRRVRNLTHNKVLFGGGPCAEQTRWNLIVLLKALFWWVPSWVEGWPPKMMVSFRFHFTPLKQGQPQKKHPSWMGCLFRECELGICPRPCFREGFQQASEVCGNPLFCGCAKAEHPPRFRSDGRPNLRNPRALPPLGSSRLEFLAYFQEIPITA